MHLLSPSLLELVEDEKDNSSMDIELMVDQVVDDLTDDILEDMYDVLVDIYYPNLSLKFLGEPEPIELGTFELVNNTSSLNDLSD